MYPRAEAAATKKGGLAPPGLCSCYLGGKWACGRGTVWRGRKSTCVSSPQELRHVCTPRFGRGAGDSGTTHRDHPERASAQGRGGGSPDGGAGGGRAGGGRVRGHRL